MIESGVVPQPNQDGSKPSTPSVSESSQKPESGGDEGSGNQDFQNKLEELRNAAEKFEARFINLMLKNMRNAVPKSDFLSGNNGVDVFQKRLDSKYASLTSSEGGTGISDLVYNELKDAVTKGKKKVLNDSTNSSEGANRNEP